MPESHWKSFESMSEGYVNLYEMSIHDILSQGPSEKDTLGEKVRIEVRIPDTMLVVMKILAPPTDVLGYGQYQALVAKHGYTILSHNCRKYFREFVIGREVSRDIRSENRRRMMNERQFEIHVGGTYKCKVKVPVYEWTYEAMCEVHKDTEIPIAVLVTLSLAYSFRTATGLRDHEIDMFRYIVSSFEDWLKTQGRHTRGTLYIDRGEAVGWNPENVM